ncbi:MAG: GNAT family N-acetyltransferase [Rhodospirillum sp.]|nr:GNAT family N-acetyltransferase [Rhodospirillum sp.]MCF8487817.1 GNAT family N-acetyltransferase [Rhodospirillum sp.]MCF8499915.1 GNAT family N-acetyltransferase [Rhodospirillum sp.]
MTQPLIRPATLEDVPAIQAIYAPYVMTSMATFETIPPDVAEMRTRISTLLDGGYPVLVGEMDSRIAGYAYAGPFHRRAAYRPTVENSVYIDGTVRRGGLGRALMEHLIVESAAVGFRQMIAVITSGPDRSSEVFHRSLGFQEMGKVKSVGWKFGQWLDIAYYQLSLGNGDQTPPLESGSAAPS